MHPFVSLYLYYLLLPFPHSLQFFFKINSCSVSKLNTNNEMEKALVQPVREFECESQSATNF